MTKSKAGYHDLAFKTDATAAVKSYDGLVSHLLQDDAYEKVYPSIGNLVLHDRLVEFLQDENNWPDANSVGSSAGNVFKKPNGQQIDSSRRYLAVRDSDDHIDLYVQITKGRNLGRFKMLTNEQDIAYLLKFGLEWMRDNGKAPIVKDFTKAVVDGNLFVPRERQELVSRTINANILISQTQSNRKIDVTRLGVTGAKPATTKTKDNASAAPVSSSATSSSSSTSFSNTNRKSRPATKTEHVNPTTSSVSSSATPSKSRNTSATSSDSHMNTSVTHIVKAKTITVPTTSTRSFAIKDETKKTTTKTVDNRKKKNGTSNQPPSSVSRTDSESEEDEPAVLAIKTITNVKVNDARVTPVCQRLRQRKIVAATATATTKESSGSSAAAKSSKGPKKPDNNKRKNEDLDDDGLNGSSSKKPKKDVAASTIKTKAAKK